MRFSVNAAAAGPRRTPRYNAAAMPLTSQNPHGKPRHDVGEIGRDASALPGLGTDPAASRFDVRDWFPPDRRGHPLELEIGSGKGTFLVQQARAMPEVNYVGVEYAAAFWRHAADRCRRHGLQNVRALHADARTFVQWHCADAIFRQVHIYFPDPWPKKRHNKRRLIQESFLRELHRTLTPDAAVRIVTDHDDYFAWIEEHAGRVTDLFERGSFEKPLAAGEGEVVGSNFERKYRREGRPFHGLTLHRR